MEGSLGYALCNLWGVLKKILPLLVLGALGSPAALADIVLSIQPITTNPAPGDTGDMFDVLLSNTGSSEVDIAAFVFGVTTTDTDITFTEADTSASAAPYIFAGNSFDDAFLGGMVSIPAPVGLPALPSQDLVGSDLGDNPGSFTAVGAGATTDLGRVLFNVAPNATMQTFTVSFIETLFPNPPGGYAYNNLSDENGNAINVDSLESADFNMGSSAPEPASLLLLPIGLASLWMFSRPRRARA